MRKRMKIPAPAGVTADLAYGPASTEKNSLTVPWDVEPGTYTATHTYTATQP